MRSTRTPTQDWGAKTGQEKKTDDLTKTERKHRDYEGSNKTQVRSSTQAKHMRARQAITQDVGNLTGRGKMKKGQDNNT